MAATPTKPQRGAQVAPKGRVKTSASVSPAEGSILLNVGAIDTNAPEAQELRELAGSFEGKRLHLVQFVGPTQPDWYQDLESTGADVIQYIPSFAYLVYGDQTALSRVQGMAAVQAAVRWDGPFLDRYKIQAGAQAGTRAKMHLPERDLFAVQLVRDPEANAATLKVVQELSGEAFKSQWSILKYVDLVVSLPASAVEAVAARPDVVSIDWAPTPEMLDERQDRIVSGQLTGSGPTPGDYLAYLAGRGFTQAQFTASNFAVDITDSGIDNATTTPNHFGLRVDGLLANPGRVAYARLEGTPNPGSTIQGCDGHGNINAHIVAGYVPDPATLPQPGVHADGAGFRYGLGVAPFVRVGSSVIFDDGFTSPNIPNLQARAYNDNARLSSNSWGTIPGSGAYDARSQTYDALVRDAQPASSVFPTPGNQEMVILFAAGNSGPGANTVAAPSTAKNVITVGAAEGVQAFGGADDCGVPDTGADSADDIIGFSSRGPTDDGRSKPDIMAPGTHITGGVFQAAASEAGTGAAAACFNATGVCGGPVPSDFFPLAQQFYTASSGTSHSTPALAGGAALVRQHFINGSITAPSPAMTKAALVNSARYMTGLSAGDTLPSNNQGMGMMNLDTLFNQMAAPRILRDQVGADMFTASGQFRIFTGTVAGGAEPFRVTLAWSDAPGPTVGNSYVNNLDLEVTVGGNTYRGNVFSGASSVTGGIADVRNNVESVFLPAGVTGTFSVRVTATNIAGDGVPGVGGALDQDFALMIANANPGAGVPVIGAGAATIVTEGCSPANGVLDPDETDTVSFCLVNGGTADTVNAVGTLQATGGVTSPSGPQSYGVIVAGGPPVCRDFTFTVGALACGANVVATIQVQDGAADLGSPAYTLPTGLPATNFSENFDGVTPPALPAGWTSVSGAGADNWTTVTVAPDTPPNDAFVNDPATVSDTYLVTPNIVMPATPSATLSFRHVYILEAPATPPVGYDGGVLEVKIGAGAFQDVIAAGGTFVAGGYNRTIDATFGSPIAGRLAWSGNSGGYVTSTVTLPAAVSGQTIQLRWRRATDISVAAVGWRVDTITLQGGRSCCGGPVNADLGLTKTDGQASYFPGQTFTYTIVASNAGPDPVIGAAVTDTFPADLTNVSWTCSATSGSSCGSASGTGHIATTVGLGSGGSATFMATVTASLAAAGSIANTATVAPPGGVTDPNPDNNSATDTDTRTPAADLGLTKTDGQTTYRPGGTFAYTIVATNTGPDAVIGAIVADNFPADLVNVSWTCTASAGSSCASASGTGFINTPVNLLVGGMATFTANVTASTLAAGDITNTATVAPTGSTTDPNPANNSASDTDTRLGGAYYTVTPCRLVDTRVTPPPLAANDSRNFTVTGACSVPANAGAVMVNVTVVGQTDFGNLRLYPAGEPEPNASTINFVVGRTRANNAIVPVGASGQITVKCDMPAGSNGTTNMVLDVFGYFIN